MVAVVAELTWLSALLEELGITITKPVKLFFDNTTIILDSRQSNLS